MAKKESTKISTSRSTLVAVVKYLCLNLPKIMALLRVKFPLKYADEKFIDTLYAEAEVVENLPVIQSRIASRQTARTDLVGYSQDAMTGAGFLTQYIRAGFPAERVDMLLQQAAIAPNYEKTARQNWDAAKDMLSGMIDFMAEHNEVLVTKGSMPPTFRDETAALNVNFLATKEDFGNFNGASIAETSNNDKLINALYERTIGILKDAQLLFRNEQAERTFYTFAAMQRQAVPGLRTIGGIRSGLIDAISQRPIEDAVIRTDYFEKSTKSAKNGRFELKPLPEGTYSLEIEAIGYLKKTVTGIKVETGIMATVKKVALERVPEGEGAGAH